MIQPGGRFMVAFALADGLARTVPAGSSMSFWVEHTAGASIDAVAAGESVTVIVDDRWTGPTVTLPNTGNVKRVQIAWGMAANVHRIVLRVSGGALDLRAVWLYQAWGAGHPAAVDPAAAKTRPLLTVYGNSIAFGQASLGFQKNSDGYADRLAALRGWRLSNGAVGGSSAACYGVQHTRSVINTSPNVLIVAYGVNDMLPGPDYFGCDPDIDAFRAAMDRLVVDLQAGLPGVPIYLEAIIPTPRVTEETRAQWNQVISDVGADHGVPVIDPSSTLDLTTDYADTLHPNNRGHAKMAAAWNAAIPS